MITKWSNGDIYVKLLWRHLVIYAKGRMCWTYRRVAYLDRIPGPFSKWGLPANQQRRRGWFIDDNYKLERFM